MSDFENNVNEVIEDLKKKIEDISSLGKDAADDKLAKVNDVKQKAITVLTQVSNKISDSVNSAADLEDLENGIEVVKIRSKKLYDDAVKKIDKLINEEVVNEVKENIKDVKNDIDEFFEKEEVKNALNDAKDVTVEIADKAINCLKEWLKPEDK